VERDPVDKAVDFRDGGKDNPNVELCPRSSRKKIWKPLWLQKTD
jgi:hypothetical protein